MPTLSSPYRAPKAVQFGDAVRSAAHVFGLKVDVQSRFGWFTESGTFTVTGDDLLLGLFRKWLERATAEFNGG